MVVVPTAQGRRIPAKTEKHHVMLMPGAMRLDDKERTMTELELATTEQIVQELARRPLRFVLVAAFTDGQDRNTGLLGHTPDLEGDEALYMLKRAEEFFADPPACDGADDKHL